MESYNDALQEQLKKNAADTFKQESKGLSAADYAETALAVAGIFDPTPASDLAGAAIAAARGDAVGAVLSLVSVIPYFGDAVAKPAKLAKLAPKTAEAIAKYMSMGSKISDKLSDWADLAKQGNKGIINKESAEQFNKLLQESGLSLEQVAAARKKALDTVQKAMRDAKQNIANCKRCKLRDEGKKMLQMPQNGKNGKWKSGDQPADGNGVFEFSEPKTLPDGRVVKEIEFKNGAPNFDKYVEGEKYELWSVTGDVATDKNLLKEMNPNLKLPDDDNFVLHHFEDGKVAFIPREIHDKKRGGVGHTGGNSMINNELF